MSYDIRFGVRVAGAGENVYAVIGEPEFDSPTYNIGTMLRKCMDWDFKQGEWYSAKEAIPKIERGIHELTFNASEYKQYEPDNGWGDIGSARKSLESVVRWFTDWDGLKGSWNENIPIECIYICW